MRLLPHGPEPCASTSSATPARVDISRTIIYHIPKMTIDWDKIKRELELKEKYRRILGGQSAICDRCGAKMVGTRCDLLCPVCGARRTCDD